jgi:hypothetical protein
LSGNIFFRVRDAEDIGEWFEAEVESFDARKKEVVCKVSHLIL